MATPIAKNASVVGLMEEVTEGVYVAPAAATNYIQVLDGIESNPAKETVERAVLSASIGKVAPRAGLESVSGSIPVEMRASGTEGAAPQYGLLLEAALGAERAIGARITTKLVGNTASALQIQDADIGSLNLYDVIVVLESGAHHVCYVSAKDSTPGAAFVTVTPSKPTGVFSGNVQISKNKMYYTANSGHPTFSLSTYWANEITQKAIGCRVSTLALANFSTGQIANWDVSFDGLTFDRVDGAAPHTPSYHSVLPPIVVSNACVYQNGTALKVNNVDFSVANTVAFVEEICAGRTSSRITERVVTGSMNPYMDDTSVAQFTLFDASTGYSIFMWAANPSGVAGEFELGSVCGVVLPNCVTTEMPTGDIDGLLTDEISFSVNRGGAGTTEEVYIGFI